MFPHTPTIERFFEMGNVDTFQMKKLMAWVVLHCPKEGDILNVFGGRTRLIGMAYQRFVHNDINPNIDADYHVDAKEIDKAAIVPTTFDGVILDPPYTMFQAVHSYDGRMEKDISRCLNAVDRILKPGGTAITLGYNTTGFGMKRGYAKEAILIVNLGASHNDILVTVERKRP